MPAVKILILLAALHSGPHDVPNVEVPPVQQEGWATWYGNGDWHGSITATGEEFKPLEQTCASRSIPLNTMVLVEDVDSGRRVWCRVNDRGPYGARLPNGEWGVKLTRSEPGKWRGVMDLSLGTARVLSGVNEGRPPNHNIRIRYWRRRDPDIHIAFR